jgi:hypothetical protein
MLQVFPMLQKNGFSQSTNTKSISGAILDGVVTIRTEKNIYVHLSTGGEFSATTTKFQARWRSRVPD